MDSHGSPFLLDFEDVALLVINSKQSIGLRIADFLGFVVHGVDSFLI